MASFKEQLEARLGEIADLPTLPSTVVTLNTALANPKSSAADIAQIMSADPSLTTNLLRLANSAAYGGRAGAITSVPQAVTRIGFRKIGRLFTTAAVIQRLAKFGTGLDHKRFWQHCLTAAITTQVIQRHGQLDSAFNADEAYVAGLLHDIGVLVLDQYFPEELHQAWHLAEARDCPSYVAERLALGVDHGEIGALFLEHWNLPAPIVEAVACHHQPDLASPANRKLAQAVYLADAICTQMGIGDGGDGQSGDYLETIWGELGLTVDHFQQMVDEISAYANQPDLFGGLSS